MSIKKIYELKKEWDTKIVETANNIHPKLLGTLAYEDFFNNEFFNNNLNDEFDKHVRNLIDQSKVQINSACDEYLLNLVNDMSLILPNTGYLTSTGEECYTFKGHVPSDYMPCVEIESIWEGVNSLRYETTHRPFWLANNYTVFGNNESVVITRDYYGGQLNYMQTNKQKFNRSFGETNLQKLERAIKLRETEFDYPIYVPALSAYEDGNIKGHMEEAVRRHLILKKVMQNQEILDDNKYFKSTMSYDGIVTLEGLKGDKY